MEISMTPTLLPLSEEIMSSEYVPQNICGFFWRFLSLPQTSIRAEVLGPRVNRGAGHGLEIPVRFIFQGHAKGVGWVRTKIKDAEEKVEKRFKKCMKNAI